MTGVALIGSSTPPICAAALMCTRLPTCAHDPTSACESTIVPSSTYAPTLMNIGGMHTTDAADISSAAHRRAAGNHADLLARGETARRIRVLVDKRQHFGVAALHQLANAKAQQDALLHPGVGLPFARNLFGGANLPRGQRIAKAHKFLEHGKVVRGDIRHRIQALDFALEFVHVGQYNW